MLFCFVTLHFLGILIIITFSMNNSTYIYLYPGKCGVRSSLFRFYCLKGANCICLDEFYESDPAFCYESGGSRMISEGIRSDRISVLILRIRTDRPEQTV